MFKTYNRLLITSFFFLFILSDFSIVLGQNNALVLNGAYIKLYNGTFASPVYLVVNNGANTAISRNSGWIISEKEGNYVEWITNSASTYTFPFGYGTTDYIPVNINKTATGASDSIIVSTWATNNANTTLPSGIIAAWMVGPAGATAINSAIDRFWQIRMAANVSGTTDLSFRGAESATTSVPLGSFSGQEWNIPQLQWFAATGSGSGVAAGSIGSVTGITMVPYGTSTSSPYVLTLATLPLPIELVSFSASCENNNTHIKWTNASETNVWNIELQKSVDLNYWTTIYTAQPSNSSFTTNYNYVYNETNNSAVYYRLKTNNNDGSADISGVITNQPCNSDGSHNTLSAYYYQNMINVLSQFADDAKVSYSLYDLQGKRIVTGEYTAGKGEEMVSLPTNDLADGIYIFNAESNSTFYNKKIIVAR